MFSQRSVKELLGRYVLVKLYTDQIPPVFQGVSSVAENLRIKDRFGDQKLPLYAIVKPIPGKGAESDFDKVAIYTEGKINNEEAFKQFLRAHLPAPAVASRTPSK